MGVMMLGIVFRDMRGCKTQKWTVKENYKLE
jgi:hypothetical protein